MIMAIKVVQWGTGTAGLRSLTCILNNPALELVGLHVARAERAGRDAGSFVGAADTGVLATNSVDELLGIEADCLCYMGSFATGGIKDVLPFLPRRAKRRHPDALHPADAGVRPGGAL